MTLSFTRYIPKQHHHITTSYHQTTHYCHSKSLQRQDGNCHQPQNGKLDKIIETNTLNLTEQVSQYVNDVIIQIQNTRIILVSVYYPIADKAPMQVTLTQQLNNELPKTYPIIMGGISTTH